MKNFVEEFKKFAIKGNAMDLAVGVVIGAAFNSIVSSLVKDIITPPIGKLTGGADFTDLFINLSPGSYETLESAQSAGAVTWNYGLFLNALIDFLIIAFAVFLAVKVINRLRGLEEKKISDKTKEEKECSYCKTKIDKDATRCPNCTSALG